MRQIKLTMPIYWQKSKNKRELLSMNGYRNWHYTVTSKFKRDMEKLVTQQLENTAPIEGTFKCSMELFYERSSCDGSNIIPLIEKVILDALQSIGLIEGDSVKFHKGTSWTVVGQDKTNPRCEISVYLYKE